MQSELTQTAEATPETEEPRALIVEDERDMNTLITYHLERNGFRTMSALDGEIGLLLAMRNRFDVVILDLMLPSMSGIEVCRQIQSRCTPPPAIIILTAVSKEIVGALGQKLPASRILHKPFKPFELVQLLQSIVRPRQTDPTGTSHENR